MNLFPTLQPVSNSKPQLIKSIAASNSPLCSSFTNSNTKSNTHSATNTQIHKRKVPVSKLKKSMCPLFFQQPPYLQYQLKVKHNLRFHNCRYYVESKMKGRFEINTSMSKEEEVRSIQSLSPSSPTPPTNHHHSHPAPHHDHCQVSSIK